MKSNEPKKLGRKPLSPEHKTVVKSITLTPEVVALAQEQMKRTNNFNFSQYITQLINLDSQKNLIYNLLFQNN